MSLAIRNTVTKQLVNLSSTEPESIVVYCKAINMIGSLSALNYVKSHGL